MAVFPTTSSLVLELDPYRYDLRQLDKAVKRALESRKYVNDGIPPTPVSSSDPSLFHLHTFELDITLNAPQPWEQRWREPDRANPAYEVFDLMRTSLASALDPLTPLTLLPPTPKLLNSGESGGYLAAKDMVSVHLPDSTKARPLVRFFDLPNQAAKEWMPNAQAVDMKHWLTAMLSLDPDQTATRKGVYRDNLKRFVTETSIRICWVPDGEGVGSGTEVKLLVTIDVKADWTAIVIPLPDIGRDMLGLVLHSLLPTSTPSRAQSESQARAQALQYFFSCLRPAPDHSLTFNVNVLQPLEMKSKLLPFQARTLALLLQREGAGMVPSANNVAGEDPLGFWESFDLGKKHGRIAFRRTTGDIVFLKARASVDDRKGKGREVVEEVDAGGLIASERKDLPFALELSGVKGTMLCEEMGLGKTLEALTLVILHRHPRSVPRPHLTANALTNGCKAESPSSFTLPNYETPTIDFAVDPIDTKDPDEARALTKWAAAEKAAFDGATAYDDEAKLSVSEVGATLIVTPPSLLKQWVAEMRKHTPSLRVSVYEGWKPLIKGLTGQRAAASKARNAKTHEKRKRQFADYRKSVQKKYQRLNSGGRVKREKDEDDSDYEEDHEDPSEESSLAACQRQFLDYVRVHDVVLTTYNDLSSDLKVALPAPSRSRRSSVNYNLEERPRSPLVMVEWWRVIMDEVQLHGDSSAAASMVSLIPRKHSLAVSGTPARTDIRDLMGSLKFLRVPVIPYDGRLWHRLQQAPMRSAFEGVFQSLAIRTTKKEVVGEFSLPRQTRFVIPVELSAVEMHYYNDTLDRQRQLLHLSLDDPDYREPGWVLDRSLFRTSLQHLRQICTHIQVGQLQAPGQRVERLHLGRQLMTMSEALDKMRNDHSQEFIGESRAQMRLMIRKAQLMMLKESDEMRFANACLQYTKVRDRIKAQIGPMRQHLARLLEDRKADRKDRESTIDSDDESPERGLSQQQRESAAAITAARQSIRETLLIEHQCWFFEGDVHHIQKEVDKEVECYDKAEEVRRELLSAPLKTANGSVDRLHRQLKRSEAVTQVDDLQTPSTKMPSGLLSRDAISQANDLLEILNGNAELVYHWRNKIIEGLSSKIESEADVLLPGQTTDVENPENEYYAEALNAQGHVEALLTAYAAAIADRKEFLLEERSLLAEHDDRTTKARTTTAAKQAQEGVEEEVRGEVEQETSMLMAERQVFRHVRDEKDCKRPLKGLLIDLNAIAMAGHRSEEIALAQAAASQLKRYIATQTEYHKELLKELDSFRAIFNRRLLYFKALQEISDLVTAPETKDADKDIIESSREIAELEAKLGRMVVKGRYLQYLGTKTEGDDDELRDDCIVCMGSSDDQKGVLLDCGHFFCQSCFREFRRTATGRKCPSCRVEINVREIKSIKLTGNSSSPDKKPEFGADASTETLPASNEAERSSAASRAEAERQRRLDDLARLKNPDRTLLREIAAIDMMGEYGSKINFLIKHLMWYKAREPDARHVIFSNWSDSMRIVERALQDNRISYTSFDQGTKTKDVVDQFRRDPSISVFLLHAERESSGLTLTSCRVVHLLEPVLRHSFELQAIGRVDRLGQDKETTVFCYATMDTVESRILSQGVRNGTSIYLRDESADQVVASMPNVVSAAHKGGDLSNTGNEDELLKLIL